MLRPAPINAPNILCDFNIYVLRTKIICYLCVAYLFINVVWQQKETAKDVSSRDTQKRRKQGRRILLPKKGATKDFCRFYLEALKFNLPLLQAVTLDSGEKAITIEGYLRDLAQKKKK